MSRYYYLDAMRSVLMILGIVLHAAVIYSSSSWLAAEQSSVIYNNIVSIIHLFRMPAFFIVSGFFTHMTLSRYRYDEFLKIRLPRLAIPLIMTVLTLNSLQYFIISDYKNIQTPFLSLEYWQDGLWVSHLWFLITLIYYSIISALVIRYFNNPIKKVSLILSNLIHRAGNYSLVLLAFVSLLVVKLSYISIIFMPDIKFDWLLTDSIRYSTYFIFGLLAGYNKEILISFTQVSWKKLLITASSMLIIYTAAILHEEYKMVLLLLLEALSTWLLCYFCFIFFYKLCNASSTYFSYLSEASYSIYLLHHILVIVIAIILMPLSIPLWIKFITIMLFTFFITVAVHHFLILKYPFLRFLFNGKK